MPTINRRDLTPNLLQSRANSWRHLNPKFDPFFCLRVEAQRDNPVAVQATQWRTRFIVVERKLIQVRACLPYDPQDTELRREAETLEAIYKELLAEPG